MYYFSKFNLLKDLGKRFCPFISKIQKIVNIVHANNSTFKNLSQENSHLNI